VLSLSDSTRITNHRTHSCSPRGLMGHLFCLMMCLVITIDLRVASHHQRPGTPYIHVSTDASAECTHMECNAVKKHRRHSPRLCLFKDAKEKGIVGKSNPNVAFNFWSIPVHSMFQTVQLIQLDDTLSPLPPSTCVYAHKTPQCFARTIRVWPCDGEGSLHRQQ
jgi:hypothetical protein